MRRPLKPFPTVQAALATNLPNPRTKRTWFILGGIIGLVIVLVAAGGIAYRITHHKPTASHTTSTSLSHNQLPAPSSASGNDITKQHVSNGNDLNLRFTYPSDWTVTPTSNNNASDQPIILASPLTSIIDANGASVTAKVVIMIRPGGAQMNELASGSATVGQDSTQIAYRNPTASQHQYPYLTFIHLPSGQNNAGAFDEVVITGITKFMKGQTLTADNLSGLDPLITARFYSCRTNACDGPDALPLDLTADQWENSSLTGQVQNIFTSLQLN